ncbi:hypothetical protein Dimus_032493 [Dionaea muscipula]
MATISGACSLHTPRFPVSAAVSSGGDATTRCPPFVTCQQRWIREPVSSRISSRRQLSFGTSRMMKPVGAVPEKISEKVAESVKQAEELCAGDPTSGECVAAWDEVEELSAAASHARAKNKDTDVLETYCKDNPETDECRTYED